MSLTNGHRSNVVIASVEDGVVKINVKWIAAAITTVAIVLFGGVDNARAWLGWGPETMVEVSAPDVEAAVADALEPIQSAVDAVGTTVELMATIQEDHTNGEHDVTMQRLDEDEAKIADLDKKHEGLALQAEAMTEQIGKNTAAVETVSGQSTEIIGLVRELITKETEEPQ